MDNFFKTQKIYTDNMLQSTLLHLEEKYPHINMSEKYNSSVNFSENYSIPFFNWFRYREGFSSKLIYDLIANSKITKDELIVDPFSGSGTTPMAAVLNGFDSLGIDVNPLSVFISNVKLKNYQSKLLDDCKFAIIDFKEKATEIISEIKYSSVKKYFILENFQALCGIRNKIDSIQNSDIRNIFLTAFLCIVEESSCRRRDGNGLKIVPPKITNVNLAFYNKLDEIIDDLNSKSEKKLGLGICFADSAKNLNNLYSSSYLKDKNIGAIIFSPPYPNSFDYFESYKLELIFGGFAEDISGINVFRQKAVRSFVGTEKQNEIQPIIDDIASEIELAIPTKENRTGRKDFRTRKVPNMIRAYFHDMREIIRQCGVSLNKGKKMYIVIDQSAYVGIIVPTDILLAYISEECGFEVVQIIECRKARTSTQQIKDYPYLKNALRESIVELIKR